MSVLGKRSYKISTHRTKSLLSTVHLDALSSLLVVKIAIHVNTQSQPTKDTPSPPQTQQTVRSIRKMKCKIFLFKTNASIKVTENVKQSLNTHKKEEPGSCFGEGPGPERPTRSANTPSLAWTLQ